MENGIDTSKYQGDYDPKLTGQDFIIAKASEGVSIVDPYFHHKRQACRDAGIPFGAYHFCRPLQNSPEDEAQHFLDVLKDLADYEPVFIDYEVDGHPNPVEWVRLFKQFVKDKTGLTAGFYTYRGILCAHDWNPVLGDSPLWIAAPGFKPGDKITNPYNGQVIPYPVFIHQYDEGPINGISGNTDLDALLDTIDRFKSFGRQPTQLPPDTTTSLPNATITVDTQGTKTVTISPTPPKPPVAVSTSSTGGVGFWGVVTNFLKKLFHIK